MFKNIQTLAVIVVPLALGGATLAWAAAGDPVPPAGGAAVGDGHRAGDHEHHWDPAAHHKQACMAGYARRAAMFAYLDATLELTDQQKPLFAKWRQAALDVATKVKASCLDMPPPKPDMHPSVVEQNARMEKMLSMRLEGLKATQAPLQALYEALTPAQRMMLDHRQGGGMDGRSGWGRGGGGMGGPGRDGWGHGGDGHG